MMEVLYPKKCILPSIELPIHVPVNCFNSISSLLIASDLMKLDNLLFANMNYPLYGPLQNINGNYADINTGDVFYS